MSMHRKPLTDLERAGLEAHGLDIGTPSQLSDAFRQGIAWALAAAEKEPDWSDSKTLLSGSWKNPLHSWQDRLLIADGAVHFKDEVIANLRQQLATAEKDAALLKGLRGLCGYVENGSNETVSIFQDDATRDWVVRVDNRRYYRDSFTEALTIAIDKEKDLG